MNEKLDIDVKTLKPFKKFLYTIGELPTSYLMSMTYEEQLVWLCNYLTQTIIPTINNNAEAVKEVQDLVLQLQEYINNYFDNLDVQEEINNKLDEMAESGVLSDIIQEYLEVASILAYNTLNDLKSASNLINGSFVKTYGNESLYDGFGRFYKIREKTLSDIPDDINIIALTNYGNLVAELIPNMYVEKLSNQNINMNRLFRIVDSFQYQGACQYNANIVLIGYNGNDSKARIVDVNGNLINEYPLQSNTHCNSIVFNTNDYMFYIANGDGTIDKYNTQFIFQERITIPTIYSLCFYKNVMYGLDTNSRVYNFNTEEYINLDYSISSVLQSFTIHNEKIYVLNSYDNNIYTFTLNGKILSITKLDEGNGLFPYGEGEEIFTYNDKVYINTIIYASSGWRNDFLNQIWETSIDNNINVSGLDPIYNSNLYVDSTLRNNPTGYENNGFNYLTELSIINSYRKQIVPQIIINGFIGSNKLYGTINSLVYNHTTNDIELNIYDSNLSLKTENNSNSSFSGNVYFSNIKCLSYCNFKATAEGCDVILSDASLCTNAVFKYCKVDITNAKTHVFTATNSTFNSYTIQDPTQTNNTFKSILSMPFVKPYSITFMMSGSTFDSLTIQVNSSRHSSINSNDGLTIATSRGNINLKTTGITQDSNVYCYGVEVNR